MPRIKRIYIPHCLYYVTAKANLGENLFGDEKDYRMYMELLKKYKQQYGFKMFAYSLLPANLGLVLELDQDTSVSMIMHDINSMYTKYFNSRYNKRGHLFSSRFKALIVEKDPYLLDLISFVHNLPVTSGLVSSPEHYTFSSYMQYVHYPQNADVYSIFPEITTEINEALGAIKKIAADKNTYAQFFASLTAEHLREFAQKLPAQGFLGSADFVRQGQEILRKKEQEADKQENPLIPAISVSIAIILAGTTVAWIYYQKGMSKIQTPPAVVVQKILYRESLKDLDGTEWIAEVSPEGHVATSYPKFDKITFSKGAIGTEFFRASGFPTSNYGLTTLEDGTIVWETMQRSSNGDVIFWRGEQKEGVMRGKIIRKPADGKTQDTFTFSSPGFYKVKENQ